MKITGLSVIIALCLYGCGSPDEGGGGPETPSEGFVAEECTMGFCTSTSDCESSHHCNFAIDTGQDDRGVCQALGCGPLGSVCEEDELCAGELLCNDYYKYEKEPSGYEDGLASDGVPLQPQCRPGNLGDPCHSSSDCSDDLSCNDLYFPPECQDQGEGDLCDYDSDCPDPEDGPEYSCNKAYFDCFEGPWNFDCRYEPETEDALDIGRCEPRGDAGSPCMDTGDCVQEFGYGDELHCVRYGSPDEFGKCYEPGYGYTGQRCDSDGDCVDEEFCVEQPGACGIGASAGSSCENDSECRWGQDCEEGECE